MRVNSVQHERLPAEQQKNPGLGRSKHCKLNEFFKR